MNTQQLKCFICVADKLNFTKASEELYLSTPAVTHNIKSLEDELGAKLFYRTSKVVRLTEVGNIFYTDAKEILSKIELSQKKIAKSISQKILFLRVGCTCFTELDSLQSILKSINQQFPNIYPIIFKEDYFKLKTMFVDKHLDIMFATNPMIDDIDYSFKKLKEVKSYALCKPDSLFADKEVIAFEDLKSTTILILDPKSIPFKKGNILQEKITLHMQDHFDIRCENEQTAILLVKSGYGVAILPEYAIPKDLTDIAICQIEESSPSEYGIAYQKKAREKHIKYFIDNF